MKKYLPFLLLAITLVLGACSNTEDTPKEAENAEKEAVEKEVETAPTDPKSSEQKDTPNQNEKEEPVDMPDLFDIQLNSESQEIELLTPEGKPVVLSDNSPSEPVKSPNDEKAAYLSPWGWEELSELYIVDLKDGSQHVLISHGSENKPKDVIWEDDEHVLVIIGYPYGTVSVGGTIYRINIETNEKEVVKDYESDIQITNLLRIEDGVLYYSGIQYTDDEMNEHKDYSNQLTLETE